MDLWSWRPLRPTYFLVIRNDELRGSRQQFPGGEARHDRGQPDVLARRRGLRAGRRRPGTARPRRPPHGLRPDHALFPQPQGINTPPASSSVADSLASYIVPATSGSITGCSMYSYE